MSTRRPLLLTAALALLAVVAPSAVASTTVVGDTFTPLAVCNGPTDILQVSRADGTSYAMPHAGVITSWSFESGTGPVQLVLRVFRPTGAVNSYLVVGDGGPVQSMTTAGLHTFPARLPVSAGDIAGLSVLNTATCASSSGNFLDKYAVRPGTLAVGQTADFIQSTTVQIDISAVLEPDADRDGFGDETQDQCPQLGGIVVPCVPDTAITKKPKRHATSPHSKLKFTSTIPGSAFSCTLDKRRPRSCASPEKYRCLGPGKHTYSVVAVSPYGLVDPTPAKVRFRVSAHRHGC